MSTEWVTAPRRTSPALTIEPASGVVTWNGVPYSIVDGAPVTAGRGASAPEPSFAYRYGGVNTSAFLAR